LPDPQFSCGITAHDLAQQPLCAKALPQDFHLHRRSRSGAEPALHLLALEHPPFHVLQADITVVPPKCRDEAWYVLELESRATQPDEILKVHAHSVIGV
jgi:hypothetical protein